MRFWGEGGSSLYPDSDIFNFSFVSSAITRAGVGEFDAITLNKALANKSVSVRPAISDETQSINGSCSPKDIETMMELTYLYFTSPREDRAAFNGEIERMYSFYTNREANPQVGYNDTTRVLLYGNSLRVAPMRRENLKQVDYELIMQIYKERFSDANGFKMVIVGNISVDELRPLLCKYIASLPSKGRVESFADTYPRVRDVEETHLFYKEANTPSALVNIYYTFARPFTPKSDLELDFLSRVLSIAYTESIREEKGGTYGVSVSYNLNKHTTPNSLIKISFRPDPSRYNELIPLIYKEIENIAQDGVKATSMDKVRSYLKKSYDQNIIDNGYWEYVIYNYLRYNIDYDTDFESVLNSVSSEDVQQTAKDMLSQHRRIEITMISK